jgi:hypothetical protein
VETHHLDVEPLPLSVSVYNADGTPNKALCLRIQDHTEIFPFVADTGKSDVMIGSNWLKQDNPAINWQ